MTVRQKQIQSSKKYRVLGDKHPDWEELLAADIASRGVLDPIEIDQDGFVLDGHLRLKIAEDLGLDYEYVVRDLESESAKVEHALKANLLHPNPGPIQWARGFNKLLEVRGIKRGRGGDRRSPESKSHGETLIGDVAEELGVPRATAFRRLQWHDALKDRPDLAAKVDINEISPREALRQAGKLNGVSKPDLGGGISHPARFSDALIPVFVDYLEGANTVLDPFAGTGRIHELVDHGFDTTGIEIEEEWASLHLRTILGDALAVMGEYDDGAFDAICTSPTYGNRNADDHEAKDASTRRSYRHDLGRKLTPGNSGGLQWGAKYRDFHERAWDEAARVLKVGGLFVLNIKDHIRNRKRQHVAGWHVTTLCRMGFELLEHTEVDTPAMRAGTNSEARLPEQVYLLRFEAT